MATTQIRSAQILDATIVAADLASDSVTTVKILDSNVTAAKLASDSVTTVKILDANVTLAKLASNSVDSSKIVDGSIAAADLGTDSVTTVKILDANVTLAKLAANSVDASKIVDGSVGSDELASTGVTPGSYTNVDLTVDTDGRITTISSGAAGELTSANFVNNAQRYGATTNGIAGDLDGVDTTYVLDFSPSPTTSLHLYLNGIRQLSGAGNEYTLSAATITFAIAPISTDVIVADYMK